MGTRQVMYSDGTPSREVEEDDDGDTFSLILSGKVTIVAGDSHQVRIELTETQLRSLAYHASQAVSRLAK